MSFEPFEAKPANAIVKKLCKGKSLAGIEKCFLNVVNAKMTVDNLNAGGVSVKASDECLALAEVIATGRGNPGKVDLPEAAEKWLAKAPEFDDGIAKLAKSAVDKVRTNSGGWAIVQEMGGWPAWTSYCRGLSSRLAKASRKRTAAKPVEGPAAAAKSLRSISCRLDKEGGDIVRLYSDSSQMNDSMLARVAELKTLKILAISEAKITDGGLAVLSALKKLEILSFANCNLKGTGFKDLVLPRLRDFSYYSRQGSNGVLKNFPGISKLHEAQFRHGDLDDAGLKRFVVAKGLRELHVSGNKKLKGTGFKHLAGLKKLNYIMAENLSFSESGFKAITSISSLTELNLNESKLPAKSLHHLGDLKKLEELSLHTTRVSDSQLDFLRELKKLKRLNLGKNPKVTDKTVAMISALPHLEYVNLSGTKVTTASTDLLIGMKKLKDVALFSTSFDSKEIKKLDRELDRK